MIKILVFAIRKALNSPEELNKIANNLSTFARPNAAADVASMIISNIKAKK